MSGKAGGSSRDANLAATTESRRKLNRRDPLWRATREALLSEAASVHVTIDDTLADRLAWAVIEELRERVTVAEKMWRAVAEERKHHSEKAWKLIRRAAPFVNAVLCMTIDRFREKGESAPALEWLADAGLLLDEKREGERMAQEIQEELRPYPPTSEVPGAGGWDA